MRYSHCKKEELVKFAQDRRLTVTPSAKSSNGIPTIHDYRRALKQADDNPYFPNFLRLPPEARNLVYDELLTLIDSFTCHPQILAVNKQINGEAKSLLYKNNLIEIKATRNGIFAHDVRCGAFSVSYNIDMWALEWPDFLRRVEWLKINTIPAASNSARNFANLNLNKMLYSLCSFLQQGNQLISVEHTYPLPIIPNTPQAEVDFLYPLHTLPNLRRLAVNGMSDQSIRNVMQNARAASSQSVGRMAMKWIRFRQLLRVLKFVHSDSYAPILRDLDDHFVLINQRMEGLLHSANLINGQWEKPFKSQIQLIEELLQSINMEEIRGMFEKRKAEEEKNMSDLEAGILRDAGGIIEREDASD